MEHTKGPWRVDSPMSGPLANGRVSIRGSDEYKSAICFFNPLRECGPTDQANARRIVACVNACEGIKTEHLEHASLDFGKELRAERDRIAALNKELVEAASEAQCGCTVRERDNGHRVGCWFPNLRAVLAKARQS